MSGTWTKLKSGIWGLRIPYAAVLPHKGQQVLAKKKSGEQTTETIEEVIWHGPDKAGGYVALCSVVGVGGNGSGKTGGGAVCQECGKPGSLVRDEEDGMLKHYGCCDMPPC